MEAFALANQPCNELVRAVASAIRSEVSMLKRQEDSSRENGAQEASRRPPYDQPGLQLLLEAASSSSGLREGYRAVAEAVQEALELYPPRLVGVAAP